MPRNNSFAGKAYVFSRPDSGWAGNLTETAKLTATDSQLLNYMGASVGINRDTVVVGASGHSNFAGAAYVFKMPPTGWADMTQTAELSASDGKGSDNLGFSAAISGDTIVLGAPGSHQFKGAAYIYVEPLGGWVNMTETARLRGRNSVSGDSLGQSISISRKIVAIGAPAATVGTNFGQGAVYIFFEPRTGWKNSTRGTEIAASDGIANQALGISVGISQSTVVSGAIGNQNPGTAYVFGP